MEEYMELLFRGVPANLKNRLIMEEVSYHRFSAEIVTLEAWMIIDSPDSGQWIWVRVEADSSRNTIEEQFLARDSFRGQELHSIEECLEYYKAQRGK